MAPGAREAHGGKGALNELTLMAQLSSQRTLQLVESSLEREGSSIKELLRVCPDPESAPRAVDLLVDAQVKRATIAALERVLQGVKSGRLSSARALSEGQREMREIAESTRGDEDDPEALAERWLERYHGMRSGEEPGACPTGIGPLDAALDGGIKLGQSYCLGGLTGHGKTTLAAAIAARLSNAGWAVYFVSSEDQDVDVASTMLTHAFSPDIPAAASVREPGRILDEGIARELDRDADEVMAPWLADSRVHVKYGGFIDPEAVHRRALQLRARYPGRPLLVVVDYVQKCRLEGSSSAADHVNESADYLATIPGMVPDTAIIWNTQFTIDSASARATPSPIPSKYDVRQGKNAVNAAAHFVAFHRPWLGSREAAHWWSEEGDVSATLGELTVLSAQKTRGYTERYVVMRSELESKQFSWWDDDDGRVRAHLDTYGFPRVRRHDWASIAPGGSR